MLDTFLNIEKTDICFIFAGSADCPTTENTRKAFVFIQHSHAKKRRRKIHSLAML